MSRVFWDIHFEVNECEKNLMAALNELEVSKRRVKDLESKINYSEAFRLSFPGGSGKESLSDI